MKGTLELVFVYATLIHICTRIITKYKIQISVQTLLLQFRSQKYKYVAIFKSSIRFGILEVAAQGILS